MTVRSGAEDGDASIEAAVHRAVFEEIGGRLEQTELVHLITNGLGAGTGIQHIFAARLASMELAARTGPEFT